MIPNPGNTILKDMSFSRKGTVPGLDFEKCIHCGRCDMVCPDYCFVWQTPAAETATITLPSGDRPFFAAARDVPILQGIDYSYCKGCEKCIAACPTGALRPVADLAKNRALSVASRFHLDKALRHADGFPVFTDSENEGDHES